jgi:hypothetical protein
MNHVEVTVFWDVAPFSLIEMYLCSREVYCRYHQGCRPDDPETSTSSMRLNGAASQKTVTSAAVRT